MRNKTKSDCENAWKLFAFGAHDFGGYFAYMNSIT